MINIYLGYNKCKRCSQYFLPNTKNTTYCPFCQGKSYPLHKQTCKVWDCKELVGEHGGRGLCTKHYSQLIRWPREKIKLMQSRSGYKICETFEKCETVFRPKSKYHFARQKYCDKCRELRKKMGIDTSK